MTLTLQQNNLTLGVLGFAISFTVLYWCHWKIVPILGQVLFTDRCLSWKKNHAEMRLFISKDPQKSFIDLCDLSYNIHYFDNIINDPALWIILIMYSIHTCKNFYFYSENNQRENLYHTGTTHKVDLLWVG